MLTGKQAVSQAVAQSAKFAMRGSRVRTRPSRRKPTIAEIGEGDDFLDAVERHRLGGRKRHLVVIGVELTAAKAPPLVSRQRLSEHQGGMLLRLSTPAHGHCWRR